MVNITCNLSMWFWSNTSNFSATAHATWSVADISVLFPCNNINERVSNEVHRHHGWSEWVQGMNIYITSCVKPYVYLEIMIISYNVIYISSNISQRKLEITPCEVQLFKFTFTLFYIVISWYIHLAMPVEHVTIRFFQNINKARTTML